MRGPISDTAPIPAATISQARSHPEAHRATTARVAQHAPAAFIFTCVSNKMLVKQWHVTVHGQQEGLG